MARQRIFTSTEVETLIEKGQTIVISEGRVLRLDGWLSRHPGGRLAIMHMVGRDATNEINVYHSNKALTQMDKFRIGRIEGPWVNLCPPIQKTNAKTYNPASGSSNDDSSESSEPSLASSATSLSDGFSQEGNTGKSSAVETDALSTEPTVAVELTEDMKLSRAEISREACTDRLIQEEIEFDLAGYPSLHIHTQAEITRKFQQLHQRVKDEGFYACPYSEYGKEMLRYSILFTGFIFALRSGWWLTSACFLGMFWQQIMFTAHDGGHLAITHKFAIDTVIATFVADFCCGLSLGWWKSSHNVHHLVTNSPQHDPDIQNIPLFANSPSFFKSLHSSYYDFTFAWDKAADIAVQYQHYTYYPVMAIARFNLYLLSWLHLLSPRSKGLGGACWTKPLELIFMACYWYLFGYCLLWCTIPTWTLRVVFVLVSHIVTMILHVQITLSHWGMPTADFGPTESFPQHQLRTTMDVDCPAWLDWFHGGLQFQAVHHLFPRVPRHNLRKVQVLVKDFCQDTGIEYKILGFVDGNKQVIGRLGEVAAQVEMLIECQRSMADTNESGLY